MTAKVHVPEKEIWKEKSRKREHVTPYQSLAKHISVGDLLWICQRVLQVASSSLIHTKWKKLMEVAIINNVYIYQIATLYTLKILKFCQLYFNKAGEKESIIFLRS